MPMGETPAKGDKYSVLSLFIRYHHTEILIPPGRPAPATLAGRVSFCVFNVHDSLSAVDFFHSAMTLFYPKRQKKSQETFKPEIELRGAYFWGRGMYEEKRRCDVAGTSMQSKMVVRKASRFMLSPQRRPGLSEPAGYLTSFRRVSSESRTKLQQGRV